MTPHDARLLAKAEQLAQDFPGCSFARAHRGRRNHVSPLLPVYPAFEKRMARCGKVIMSNWSRLPRFGENGPWRICSGCKEKS